MERFQKLHNRRLRAIIALMTAIALFFTALLYLATIANGLSDGESTELNTVVTHRHRKRRPRQHHRPLRPGAGDQPDGV